MDRPVMMDFGMTRVCVTSDSVELVDVSNLNDETALCQFAANEWQEIVEFVSNAQCYRANRPTPATEEEEK